MGAARLGVAIKRCSHFGDGLSGNAETAEEMERNAEGHVFANPHLREAPTEPAKRAFF